MRIISEIRTSEIPASMRLVEATFREFIEKDFEAEGTGIFLGLLDVPKFSERLANGNKAYVSKDDEEILGLIEIRNKSHILLIFVKKEYQGQGIGRLLIGHFLENEKWNEGEVVTVNAAPGSSGFYRSLGFQETDEWKRTSGIKYQPMEMAFPGTKKGIPQ